MKHRIEIDGQQRDIDIRPMDEGFIVYRKMYVPPLTPENISKINPGDWEKHLREFKSNGWQELIRQFLRKHIQTIGSCAILAWDGVGVVGKMYFTTKEVYEAFRQADGYFCVEHESMPRVIQSLSEVALDRMLESKSRTLQILCFNVGHFDPRYHGKGIASLMLEVLKQWAKEHSWRRLEIESCPDVVPFWALGPNVLRRSSLERRGFRMTSETIVPAPQAEFRRKAIQRILTGEFNDDDWDVKHYPGNISKVKELAEISAWQEECDKDYVMAFHL